MDKIEFVKEMEIEDFDPEELAENLVLGKKMLRQRSREQIINATYNKYAFDDQDDQLPEWYLWELNRFLEDELKHRFSIMPISKEEVELEKRRIHLD